MDAAHPCTARAATDPPGDQASVSKTLSCIVLCDQLQLAVPESVNDPNPGAGMNCQR